MRALFILGLQCFCAVVVAAQQSPAISGDQQPAAQGQVTQTTSPATIAYPYVVVCCPSVPYYYVCPPLVCPAITYYTVPYLPVTCGAPPSATTPGAATANPPTTPSPPPPPDAHPPTTPLADNGSSAGSNSGPCPPLDETQVDYKVKAILDLLGVEFNYKPLREGFKCDLMAVGATQTDAVGNDYWLPAGPVADLTLKGEKWKDVAKAILEALGPASPPSQSPPVALRVTIPAADGSSAVQYGILMLFNQKKLRLFRDGKQIGTHTIQDDGKWAAMLKDLGAAPTPTTTSSK
jgi:hypothetical protein